MVLEHCQPHKISTLGLLPLAEGGIDRWEKKIVRWEIKQASSKVA
jgi:hypothetical protein